MMQLKTVRHVSQRFVDGNIISFLQYKYDRTTQNYRQYVYPRDPGHQQNENSSDLLPHVEWKMT